MREVQVVVVVAMALLLSACSIVLPAHTRSDKRSGEQVTVELLTLGSMYEGNYEKAYNSVFCPVSASVQACRVLPPKPQAWEDASPEFLGAGVAATVASAAVGFAVDYVVTELRQEATEYESAFEGSLLVDGFWKRQPQEVVTESTKTTRWSRKEAGGDGVWKKKLPDIELTETETAHVQTLSPTSMQYAQNYYGIRIVRSIRDGDQTTKAFELVYGIAPLDANQLLMIKPIQAEMQFAKAKVLSDQWFSWLPGPIFGKLVRVPGHYVQSSYSLGIDAVWRDQSGAVRTTQVAPPLEMQLPQFDLNKQGAVQLAPGGSSVPLAGVPVSYDPAGKPVGTGTVLVTLRVTEKDPSNAKELLEKGADKLEDAKPKIQKAVSAALGG